ncbi:MAG: ABC transporter permease [Chloroflexi bacterium]|nr:ABC transporter permease [Anaerolineaceae bacterium]NLI45140.1 ABC transporter permease [Chloroflexota bacterium]HOE34328.1 ABC transporter permease [Anaerolineaceae bacterium]HOT25609.1 ABC transporter permease [Anaerolineaceae bacterium]HQH57243.1 ABC transporter permease [Anaerolineaceae bacterium]
MTKDAVLTSPAKPLYDSAAHAFPALSELKELRHYRFLLFQLIRRDLVARYKRSILGVAWTMLNPLGTMLIMTFVFSNLFKSVESYPVYILSGLIVWNFFSQGTNAAMVGLIWGGSLMQRIYLPRTIFGVSAIGTALVNLLIALIPLTLVMLITGTPIPLTVLFLPVSILLLTAFTLGFGLMLSALAIYFPDVAEMYQILLTAWMYLTPIIYPEEIIPERFLGLYRLNPMYWIVKLFRLPIYNGRIPTFSEVLPALAWSIGFLIVGWLFFTSKSDEYAYRI